MSRLRVGKLVFRDPVLLCGVLYGLLLFDASGFLRTGLLIGELKKGRFEPSQALAMALRPFSSTDFCTLAQDSGLFWYMW